MAHGINLFSILFVLAHHTTEIYSYSQQSDIKFSIPQAQKLWDNKDILGNSTSFLHPVSLGTFTACDKLEIEKVFTDKYAFQTNYSLGAVSRDDYTDNAVRVIERASYRHIGATRTIEKKVLSARGCVMACITEKDFICRDCDYFKGDGGKCALYHTTGLVFLEDPSSTRKTYVGDNHASDHYILYKRTEDPPPCTKPGEFAHPYFALGWKAMETGWYTLAHYMLDKAIAIDRDYYMAHIGKMLSNERMGYGIEIYKTKLREIAASADVRVKLSRQEQLLLQALNSLQSGKDFDDGLERMTTTFQRDTDTFKDYIIQVVEGNGNLLRFNAYQMLNKLADNDRSVFALRFLTHNLNPYKNGKGRISKKSQAAAIVAIYHYQKLGVKGAWQISSDCADIAEYYSRWSLGITLLVKQGDFLYANTNQNDTSFLFGEDENDLIVHKLDVKYMSLSLLRINEYERLHFFQLQLALFKDARLHFEKLSSSTLRDDDEQRKILRYRMNANAYFSTYDYIYDKYSKEEIHFEKDWNNPLNTSTSDLAIASRAYYWAAAAVQQLNLKKDPSSVNDIKDALDEARAAVEHENYQTLVDIYKAVVMGTEQRMHLKYKAAAESAQQASTLQDKLKEANFTIDGNEDSKEFRMLIPLGYQFEADMLRSLINDKDASSAFDKPISKDAVVKAFARAVNTPPLNISRILKGYGDSLLQRDKDKPRRIEDPKPNYVYAYETLEKTWDKSQVEGEFAAKATSKAAVERYFKQPISGCSKDFQIRSEGDGVLCWGGYVIIGVAAGVVVIIVIIVGILCLRKKAKTPRRNKEKEGAFIFSGPNLSRQDSFESSSRIGLSTLNRGSPEATPYASQTLSIQRPFHDADYSQRSNTIGGVGKSGGDFEAYSAH